ncbi:hypothetical protein SCOCK_420053 [Actinacidiphila cocklensis]|uniref:Uncharacterized protein n=1 Tax=Actinacidiphila cocklensis TaxID=887465 RepID=A0A9W4DRV9_9ACTN|nr:hypothetical protein SCOCK_420053 [Actinacidiphila cocklensis]
MAGRHRGCHRRARPHRGAAGGRLRRAAARHGDRGRPQPRVHAPLRPARLPAGPQGPRGPAGAAAAPRGDDHGRRGRRRRARAGDLGRVPGDAAGRRRAARRAGGGRGARRGGAAVREGRGLAPAALRVRAAGRTGGRPRSRRRRRHGGDGDALGGSGVARGRLSDGGGRPVRGPHPGHPHGERYRRRAVVRVDPGGVAAAVGDVRGAAPRRVGHPHDLGRTGAGPGRLVDGGGVLRPGRRHGDPARLDPPLGPALRALLAAPGLASSHDLRADPHPDADRDLTHLRAPDPDAHPDRHRHRRRDALTRAPRRAASWSATAGGPRRPTCRAASADGCGGGATAPS